MNTHGFTVGADYDDLRMTCGCGWDARWDEPIDLIELLDAAFRHRCEAPK